MEQNYYEKGSLNFRDKLFALDYQLVFLILLLGIISCFAMYSTERGNFNYYTQSHVYRFVIFFLIFIGLSFFKIQFWYKFAYLFYAVVLILLVGVGCPGICCPCICCACISASVIPGCSISLLWRNWSNLAKASSGAGACWGCRRWRHGRASACCCGWWLWPLPRRWSI